MKYLIILLFSTTLISAQNLDSLYNAIVSLHSNEHSIKGANTVLLNNAPVKCGFRTVADSKTHFDSFTPEQQNHIKKILARPERQKSIVSPSGLFRIHYDITGIHTPDYFNGITNTIQLSVDSLAMAFDSAYSFEVNYLGYKSPPFDDGDGGDDLYDIYITSLGYYGVTEWDFNSSMQNKSFIRVDNKMDFFTNNYS